MPVLIPAAHGDLASLLRARGSGGAGAAFARSSIRCSIRSISASLHSLARYAELRRRLPEAEILMGTGNLTELTDADTSGITAVAARHLLGAAHPQRAGVQVSPHTRRTIEEHDAARRIMFAAREDASLPKDYGDALLHSTTASRFPTRRTRSRRSRPRCTTTISASRRPRTASMSTTATAITSAQDALSLFRKLGVESDGAHAFYLGAELTKAEIAWRLGKRYAQDEPLDWGCAPIAPAEDRTRLQPRRATRCARKTGS